MTEATRLLPLIIALIGGGTGVCFGMLFRHDPNEPARVTLDNSGPLAIGGGAMGAMVGWFFARTCRRQPELATPVTLGAATCLGAAVAAPIGWIVGDPDRSGSLSMAIGAGLGGMVGLIFGAGQVFQDHHQADQAVRDDYAEPGG
jgi:hypothetical protein